METRLVIEGEASETGRTDPALLKAVALGRRWFNELASGAISSTIEIARREHVRDNYVRRLLPPAFPGTRDRGGDFAPADNRRS